MLLCCRSSRTKAKGRKTLQRRQQPTIIQSLCSVKPTNTLNCLTKRPPVTTNCGSDIDRLFGMGSEWFSDGDEDSNNHSTTSNSVDITHQTVASESLSVSDSTVGSCTVSPECTLSPTPCVSFCTPSFTTPQRGDEEEEEEEGEDGKHVPQIVADIQSAEVDKGIDCVGVTLFPEDTGLGNVTYSSQEKTTRTLSLRLNNSQRCQCKTNDGSHLATLEPRRGDHSIVINDCCRPSSCELIQSQDSEEAVVMGEVVMGEVVKGEDVMGEGVEGEDVMGEVVKGEDVMGEGEEVGDVVGVDVMGEGVEGEDVMGEGVEEEVGSGERVMDTLKHSNLDQWEREKGHSSESETSSHPLEDVTNVIERTKRSHSHSPSRHTSEDTAAAEHGTIDATGIHKCLYTMCACIQARWSVLYCPAMMRVGPHLASSMSHWR